MRLILRVFPSIVALAGSLLAADAPQQTHRFDPAELEGFVDGLMGAQLRAQHFAGAVVAVAERDRLILRKGYGYADFAERKPVDPERTLFRIASNSKMFVWTAVMQLVEEGRLDLRTDVNRYLKGLQVPAAFPEPVTLEHLMTHTAGFEDHVVGLFAETPDTMGPLAQLMKTQMPARVFPPGQVAAYSNYGTALAALIVEQTAGTPFERYLEEKILRRLGMAHATLAQPLPKELAADMSLGYRWTAGRLKPQPFEFVPWAPCGGMSVSGADMARFMMAHLNDGALSEARILRPETARLMRARLSSPYGTAAGMLHGFFPMDWNGEKVLGHGGDTVWFHSLTAMLPERGIGVFVAYNTDSGSRARSDFAPAFLDHYFPKELPKEPPPPKEKRGSLERFSGTYFPARSSFSDLSKIGRMIGGVAFRVDADGYLAGGAEGEPVRWRQVEPLMFQQVDGKRRIVFREDDRGRIVDYCASPLCIVAMQKQPWWESPGVQWGCLAVSSAPLLGGLVGFPIAAFRRRRQPGSFIPKAARLAAWLTCLLWLAAFAIFAAGFGEMQRVVFGPTAALRQFLGFSAAAAALSAGLLCFAFLSWRNRWWGLPGRICFSLVLLGCAGCVLWLHHWNLLGWNY